MQFLGQTHIVTVPIRRLDVTRAELQSAFEHAYWTRFEVELSEIPAVLVNLHTALVWPRKAVALETLAPRDESHSEARCPRRVWFRQGWLETPVHRRESLHAGTTLEGPAIVEQLDTTVVLEPGSAATVDELGNLIIRWTGDGA